MKRSSGFSDPKAVRWLTSAGVSALAITLVVIDDTNTQTQSEGQIVVTGSRIRRNETTSASPLTIIDPELQRKQGLNTAAEIIQQSPIANGSTQITSAISANTISNGGPGAQTVSLRGLGAERTLVLLNDRRAGPAPCGSVPARW